MSGLIGLRDLPAPTPMRDAMRAFARISRHAGAMVDPGKEAAVNRALARGPVTISSIASASEALPVGGVAVDPRRRQWRFRALEEKSQRVIYEKIVEGENVEAAQHAGTRELTKYWKRYGSPAVGAVIGTVVAI
jgi:hypothetical protein